MSDQVVALLVIAVAIYIGAPSMGEVASAIRDVARALERIATALKDRNP